MEFGIGLLVLVAILLIILTPRIAQYSGYIQPILIVLFVCLRPIIEPAIKNLPNIRAIYRTISEKISLILRSFN